MQAEELFGAAQWVAPSGGCDQPYIRGDFAAEAGARGRITICGLGFFQLFLNGRRVSSEELVPAWTSYEDVDFSYENPPRRDAYGHRIYALRYDLTPFLQPGVNRLAVWLGGGWYRKWNYGRVKLCYRIELAEPGGSRDVLSGEALRWKASHITRSEVLEGETHDLRLNTPGWATAPLAGDGWRPAETVEAPGGTAFYVQDCPGDAVTRRLAPKLLRREGDCAIYDAGENITGWLALRHHAAPGEEITIKYAEELDADGNLDATTYNHLNIPRYDTFISDGAEHVSHPVFLWHAFRYAAVYGDAEALEVSVLHADVPVTAAFDSDNETLNWLYRTFLNTQLCNMHCGLPSDCPQREGRGYTGDGQLACDAALLAVDGRAFYRKWMRDIADGQNPATGRINYTAPFIPSGGGPGGWGCAIIHVPWVYYNYYGGTDVLAQYYPNMLRYFDYLELHSENDLVANEEPGHWCLGDWCTPAGDNPLIPPPFVNTYFYIKSLREMQQIATLLGKPADATRFAEIEAIKSKALLEAYFDPATGDFAGNIEGANAFALDLGFGDARTFATTVRLYQAIKTYDTGIFGTDILTRVLFDRGEAQLAYELLSGDGDASFGRFKRQGATTLWEYWDGRHSHSHPMFGAAVRYLFRDLLGITQRPGTVGFTDVILTPQRVEGLTRIKGHITGVRGEIALAYEIQGKQAQVRVELPAGVQGVLRWGGAEFALAAGGNQLTVDA
ncbi:MAG: glycoside hydrolase family 78 protein [Oscillospiraceae bacterium]|jgi:alpha-L-rhamnosidase|nr:glycoside hydrolase family 78 protein [Oscillospiraceae bacterium]